MCPQAHIEPCVDLDKAIEYCLKSDTAVEGTQVKLGTFPTKGGGDKRSISAKEALAMKHDQILDLPMGKALQVMKVRQVFAQQPP